MPDPRRYKLPPEVARRLIDAGSTPRAFELAAYQGSYDGTGYNDRPDFFSSDDRPIQERKPCVQSFAVKNAIESNVAFAMGEGRFPVLLSLSSENDNVFDQRLGLNSTDSATLDAFNIKIIDLGRLEQTFRNGCKMAQAARSVALVLSFRRGLPCVDLVWSKLCMPTFADPADPTRVTRLEIRYRYLDKFRDSTTNGEWWSCVKEYLRVIDTVADTVYLPLEIWDERDAGINAASGAIASQVMHGFGLCPVHWYAHALESLSAISVDGRALHEGMIPLVEQYDLALSQRHRAAIYAGDPQLIATGVDDGDAIGRRGRSAVVRPEVGDTNRQWSTALYGSGQGGDKLRRGAGEFWRTENPDAKFKLLTLPGDGLKSLADNVTDLQARVSDALGVVNVDPGALGGSGDLSGRTLSFVFSKQINRVSQLREDLGRNCIIPTLNLFYRMIVAQPLGVYLPGIKLVLPILQRFMVAVDDGTGTGNTIPMWIAPMLKLKWGDYFEPSDVDEATRAATAIAAYNGKLITLSSAVEHIRSVFAISSVDQYVKTLAAEVAQRQATAMANATAMNAPAGSAPGTPPVTLPSAAKPATGAPSASRKQSTPQAKPQ